MTRAAELPVNVEPIESEHEFFNKAGPIQTSWDEARRYPRFYYRACIQAVIYPPRGGEESDRVACSILTRDISRGGINILHREQLFPGQRLDVTLHDGVERRLEVLWCRRLAERCYTAGCRFLKSTPQSPAEESTDAPPEA